MYRRVVDFIEQSFGLLLIMVIVLYWTLTTLTGCALFRNTTNFDPESMKERYIDECIELCSKNPSLCLKLSSGDSTVYTCSCKKKCDKDDLSL